MNADDEGSRPRRRLFRRRARGAGTPRFDLRKALFILPNAFTVSSIFCGFYAILRATSGEGPESFRQAGLALFFACFFDVFDGRVARLTRTQSDFGVQIDSLADVISFGIAPAILSFGWGLAPLGRLGWAAGFVFVTAAAMRLARFNIQSAPGGDKRYFAGMPSPAAAAITAATVFFYPAGLSDYREALPALAVVLVPAMLMVSTIRFRSFKTIDLRTRRPYTVLLLIAAAIMLVTTHPRFVLVAMAYAYLASAFIGIAITRIRHRAGRGAASGLGESPAAASPRDRIGP